MQNKDVEIIVSGNSHLYFGVVTDSIFSFNSVNIATKARELNTDIDLLIGNIKNREKLKGVLIPISYYSLFNELNGLKKYHQSQKRLYYNYFKIKEYNQGAIKNSLIINEPFKELMNDSFFLSFMKKQKVSKKGWRANDNFFVKDSSIIEKLKRLEINLNKTFIIDENLERIKYLNKLCKANNVKLILVLPPYSEYFYTLTNYKYNKIINKILSDNLTDIEVIDALDFMPTNLLFYENSDHLNVKGAKLFTKKLDSILKHSL
ncbi:SGNH/GDSL hydrolase family protein [Polaribacter sp. Hel1_85]|uniref:SGNH/GDSL hydrolase family protein n=1 Tax=Polaribacter sp. Hel1_85 TaxID=1250005 RepID=UPI00052CFFEC|nr:SGNH/GDSL hydrolase family protein [Polaribacter sp. Hel1_85]KGL63234.1 hypothetical protein PHEL85_0268 [Polaribacter sp. Hel1_85]